MMLQHNTERREEKRRGKVRVKTGCTVKLNVFPQHDNSNLMLAI